MARNRRPSTHSYPRTARLNTLIRAVLADEVERLSDSDERLEMVTFTEVDCAADLKVATVYCSSLSDDAATGLEDHRKQLQALLGREVRAKRVPLLHFVVDPAVAEGARIEAAIRRAHERDSRESS